MNLVGFKQIMGYRHSSNDLCIFNS